MWRVKITIKCSIGKRPDQNSILYITTFKDEVASRTKALKHAFDEAKWWFKDYEGFRLVSIEELR